MGVNIPTTPDVDWEKRFSRKPVDYNETARSVFVTGRFEFSRDRLSRFVLFCGGGEEVVRL